MSWKAVSLIAGLVLFAGAFTSCGSDDSEDPTFTVADSSIEVDEGERFTIQLDGNPTTGFNWELTNSPDSDVVVSRGSDYVASEAEEGSVGSGGVFNFEFEAVGEGSTTLEFEYVQASAGAEDTASFDVEVR